MELRIGSVPLKIDGSYILAALVMLAAIAMPVGVILFGVVPNAGASGDKSFDAYYSAITGILGVVSGPLVAGAFVLGLGLFRMERGKGACASMAASGFVVYAALIIGIFALATATAPSAAAKNALGAISTLLQAAAGSIVIYLWMLMLTGLDRKRLYEVAPLALAFAAIVFLSGRAFLYALGLWQGTAYQLAFDLGSAAVIATWLLNGTAILYHTKGRRLDMDAAYTYAALLLADAVIYGLVDANMAVLANLSRLAVLVETVVALAVLYVLSRKK